MLTEIQTLGVFFAFWQSAGMIPILTLPMDETTRNRLVLWFVAPGIVGNLAVIVKVLFTND